MNPPVLLPSLIAALHNLFTAAWIGGMIVLAFVILPALRKGIADGKTRLPLAMGIQQRLRLLAVISMAGLAITGMMLTKSSPAAGALFQFGTPYGSALAVKHLLMVAMVLTAAARTVVNRRLAKAPAPQTEKTSAALLLLNIGFGVAVLFLSALLPMLANGMG